MRWKTFGAPCITVFSLIESRGAVLFRMRNFAAILFRKYRIIDLLITRGSTVFLPIEPPQIEPKGMYKTYESINRYSYVLCTLWQTNFTLKKYSPVGLCWKKYGSRNVWEFLILMEGF